MIIFFYEIYFEKTEVSELISENTPTFIISTIDQKEESGLINGAIARLKTFKIANAMQTCKEDVYVFEEVIKSIEIKSNINFNALFKAGEILNSLFNINLTESDVFSSSEIYYSTNINRLGHIQLINPYDSTNLHDLYFEYEFDNGEIHKDTVFNQNLNWEPLSFNNQQ